MVVNVRTIVQRKEKRERERAEIRGERRRKWRWIKQAIKRADEDSLKRQTHLSHSPSPPRSPYAACVPSVTYRSMVVTSSPHALTSLPVPCYLKVKCMLSSLPPHIHTAPFTQTVNFNQDHDPSIRECSLVLLHSHFPSDQAVEMQ